MGIYVFGFSSDGGGTEYGFFRVAAEGGLVRARMAAKELEYQAQKSAFGDAEFAYASGRCLKEYLQHTLKQKAVSQAAAEFAGRAATRPSSGAT